jgi:Holliday junction resolvasome RuvABC DNA-binding subunit
MPSILASLLRALCGMGFKVGEARRALASVEDRWTDSPPPIETLLREALSELA